MERFLTPKDIKGLVTWILIESQERGWTLVLEHSTEGTAEAIKKFGRQTDLPSSAQHNCSPEHTLSAVTEIAVSQQFVNLVINRCTCLSVHDDKKMIFLAADDFHKDCFSCTHEFDVEHHPSLKGLGLTS